MRYVIVVVDVVVYFLVGWLHKFMCMVVWTCWIDVFGFWLSVICDTLVYDHMFFGCGWNHGWMCSRTFGNSQYRAGRSPHS